MITGSTGNIGSYVVDALLKNSRPNKVGLFCRDDQNLPTQIQSMVRIPVHVKEKQVFSYEVDFMDPNKITQRVHQMLRNFDGKLDVILFCHGVINF